MHIIWFCFDVACARRQPSRCLSRALNEKRALKFALQIVVDEKPSYYDFANDTVKMTGLKFVAMMTAGDKKD